jgi:2-succinyl-5-enolpyruvyl-6-hydroxy-3-cyclohexene-1-carboxylate synthase
MSSIDFTNRNTVWASILGETFRRLGLTTAVICPGSRSAPLAIAFAQQALIEAIPILDERSAAFFALGIARQTGLPVALVCTSGTAGANFYPAVIEAHESQVPLLVLTADRPPELRDCHAGQAIDQLKLYGAFPNWQTELALPSLEVGMLAYLRQTLIYAWERSLWPVPGPVHLNLPFREPLAPIAQPEAQTLACQFQSEDFFAAVNPLKEFYPLPGRGLEILPIQEWQQFERGIIIAGPAQPQLPERYCQAIAELSQVLAWPVLAEGLSPLRNYADLNPFLISTYDLLLRNQQLAAQLMPEIVIRIGELPTSKALRTWLQTVQPRQWIIHPADHNFDPLHGQTTHLRLSVETLAKILIARSFSFFNADRKALEGQQLAEKRSELSNPPTPYLKHWFTAEVQIRQALNATMTATDFLFEGKAAWLLSQNLPSGTPLFIANSMPVRDVESFWHPGNLAIQPFFNRGTNGIDGTLSTALGIAHRRPSSVMLTGDLALLHDTNGCLLKNHFVGHLTIVLINNNGGGIFEMLPIADFNPTFEAFFATPQHIDFAKLCATYEIEYELIHSWEQLVQNLNPLPTKGIRVLELQTDRKADSRWRQENLGKIARMVR